jgi:hypothetical protein
VHAHVSVNTGAVQAYVHPECDAGPRRIPSLTIETHLCVCRMSCQLIRRSGQKSLSHLIAFLRFEYLKNLLCLCFRRVGHGYFQAACRGEMKLWSMIEAMNIDLLACGDAADVADTNLTEKFVISRVSKWPIFAFYAQGFKVATCKLYPGFRTEPRISKPHVASCCLMSPYMPIYIIHHIT